MVRKESIIPFIWGGVVCMIILLIVIFSADWVVTSGSAQRNAEEMAEQAVIDQLAPICVLQFNQDSEKDKKLKELEELSIWGTKREEFVEEQGWATMPGSEVPVDGVAKECANRLVKIE